MHVRTRPFILASTMCFMLCVANPVLALYLQVRGRTTALRAPVPATLRSYRVSAASPASKAVRTTCMLRKNPSAVKGFAWSESAALATTSVPHLCHDIEAV